MINNLSAYQGTPPADEAGDRMIGEGKPIYDIAALMAAVTERVIPSTARCTQDLVRLDLLTDADVQAFVITALKDGIYRNSEWCKNSKKLWIACDVYVLTRMEWSDVKQSFLPWKYYIKLGLSKTGKAILLISCHPS